MVLCQRGDWCPEVTTEHRKSEPRLAGTQEDRSTKAVLCDNSYMPVQPVFIETLLGPGDTAGKRQRVLLSVAL